ncbi:unnamed protein product [Darwinula stevensoni]|uniref:Eukaryotic translation initiation factor 5 n=1 Tax=Darwinula stevensoni TaxID=69355 RepID=A0A7R9AD28_9CRUS|nr:unnamed protein product [Darwinula stevensoni]CAG0900382.1 unnamed protein product [Darwinula stevensoni]
MSDLLLSRGNRANFRKQLEPSGIPDPNGCMFAAKKSEPVSHRAQKTSSNRHRKLQPFRSSDPGTTMGSVNVNRNVSDAFYRYKMPRILAKVEGKGNGIKTVIPNMVDVAKALGRPPTYPTKYFGCELGAQTQFDFKNDRYIVNGSHDAAKLQSLLDGFIKKYVLCPGCDNPETALHVSQKKGIITQSCKACKSKKRKGTKTNGDGNGSGHDGVNADGTPGSPRDDSDDPPAAEDEFDGHHDDWAVDVSEEAIRRRMEDLTEGAKSLAINNDLEKTEKERVDMLYSFIKHKIDFNQIHGSDKDILAEAERLDVKEKVPLLLSELLFDANILQQIKSHRLLLLRFTHENTRAQKYLMGGIELVIQLHKAALLPKVPHILKVLYDSDILEEEVILDWGKKPSKKYVTKELSAEIRAKAEPFLKWLKEAEEEESSEGSDEDEEDLEVTVVSVVLGSCFMASNVARLNGSIPLSVQISYDDRACVTMLKQEPKVEPKKPANRAATAAGHEDEDLDIDAI